MVRKQSADGKVDVLLIQPPICDFYLTRKRTQPVGLACLAASLETHGFTVAVLDALATDRSRIIDWPGHMEYLKPFYGKPDIAPFGLFHHFRRYGYSAQYIGQQIRRREPFVVGISSLFSAYGRQALSVAKTVKQWRPEAITVLGGHHPTAMPEAVLAHPEVDFIIRGEGESAFVQLVETLRAQKDPRQVCGIGFRRPDGRLWMDAPAVADRADLERGPLGEHIHPRYYRRRQKQTLVVTASRGCPMACSYCAVGRHGPLPYRRRSVHAVLDEIFQAAEKHPLALIDFEDENLAEDRAWLLDLLAGLQKRFKGKGPELRAMNGLFPPSLNDEKVLDAMAQAGFVTLNMALVTGNPAQLKRFRRPDVRKAFSDVVAALPPRKMKAVGYLIVAAPHQSAESSLADLLYLAGLPVLVGVSVYYPAPGSRDWTLCRQLELLPERLALMRASALPVAHITSRLQAITLLRLGRVLNYAKSWIDQGRPLPAPKPVTVTAMHPATDRRVVGEALLGGFLHDGHIRGITPEGEIYRHRVDPALAHTFARQLLQLDLKGTGGISTNPTCR